MLDIKSKIEDFSKTENLVLYREDLLEIETMMRSALQKGESLAISYEDSKKREHTAKNIESINKSTGITMLKISSSDSFLSLYLRRSSGSRFYVWSDSDRAYATLLKVQAYLKDCQSKVRLLLSKISGPFGMLFAMAFLFNLSYLSAKPKNYHISSLQWTTLLLSLLFGIVFIYLKFSLDFHRNSYISLLSQSSVNFFRRNQDRILTGLIVSVPVAILTVLLTKLFGN